MIIIITIIIITKIMEIIMIKLTIIMIVITMMIMMSDIIRIMIIMRITIIMIISDDNNYYNNDDKNVDIVNAKAADLYDDYNEHDNELWNNSQMDWLAHSLCQLVKLLTNIYVLLWPYIEKMLYPNATLQLREIL